jgi:hypothetical protein
MTRTSRTLLVLGLMSIGTVIVLGMMAGRYTRVLEARQQAENASPRSAGDVSGALLDSAAERNVQAYLYVTSALKQAAEAMGEQEASTQAGIDQLRMTFERVLVESRLDRSGFQEMDAVVGAWEAGSQEVSQAYRRELDRRAAEVRDSRTGAYDPLER